MFMLPFQRLKSENMETYSVGRKKKILASFVRIPDAFKKTNKKTMDDREREVGGVRTPCYQLDLIEMIA